MTLEEKINTRQKFIAEMKGGRKDFSNVVFIEKIDLSGLNVDDGWGSPTQSCTKEDCEHGHQGDFSLVHGTTLNTTSS